MILARLKLVAAALVFAGWLTWLGIAVARKGTVQPVSRAQLAAATYLVVADVKAGDDGQPLPTVAVREVLQAPAGDRPGGEIEVEKLRSAVTPLPVAGESRTPPPGEYLIPLVRTERGTYRVAGLPASPGYPAVSPERPRVYPWTADVRAQLRAMGLPTE